jgi:hypothetical protein
VLGPKEKEQMRLRSSRDFEGRGWGETRHMPSMIKKCAPEQEEGIMGVVQALPPLCCGERS